MSSGHNCEPRTRHHLDCATLTSAWGVAAILEAIDGVEFEDVAKLSERFFANLFVEMFIGGNVTRASAQVRNSVACLPVSVLAARFELRLALRCVLV